MAGVVPPPQARTLSRCASNERGLRSLDLSNTIFTDLFLVELGSAMCHNTHLQEVYLDNCGVADEGVRQLTQGLSRNPSAQRCFRALSLQDNRIGCKGALHLARLFERPNLASTRWTRTFGGCRAVASGPGKGLRHLSLRGNVVRDPGAKGLAEALMRNDDSLEHLSVEANLIGDWGAGWFALALRSNQKLRYLSLRENPIGPAGVDELRVSCLKTQVSLVEDLEVSVWGQRPATVHVSRPVPGDGSVDLDAAHRSPSPPRLRLDETRPAFAGAASRPASALRPASATPARPGSPTAARRQATPPNASDAHPF